MELGLTGKRALVLAGSTGLGFGWPAPSLLGACPSHSVLT